MTSQQDMEYGDFRSSVLGLLEGDLSDDDFAVLQKTLREDPEAREIYFDLVSTQTSIETLFDSPLTHSHSLNQSSAPSSAMRRRARRTLCITAAAAVLLVSVLYITRIKEPPTAATLRFCDNSQWSLGGELNKDASTLPENVEFLLQQGVAELKLPHGVVAVVEAPAGMVLETDDTLRMDFGRALFQVPREGRGFTVVTPHQRFVDLGTEFGVDFSKEEEEVELQVLEGAVRVDAPDGLRKGSSYEKGRAVVLDGTRVVRELKGELTTFRRELPRAVEILLVEDFESGVREGFNAMTIEGWQSDGTAIGTINPDGKGKWYVLDGLKDSDSTNGVVGPMLGPAMGFTQPGSKVSRRLGTIAPDSRYMVSVAIGVRAEISHHHAVFSGYTISLKSGTTVLASLSDNAPPGSYNSINLLSFSWDSSGLPPGVGPGAPLSIEIGSNYYPGDQLGYVGDRVGYLDFDNLRVSVIENAGRSE